MPDEKDQKETLPPRHYRGSGRAVALAFAAEGAERTFRTNIFSYFFIAKSALSHLKEGSAIINTTSVTAYRGSSHLMDHASTKEAIVAPGPIWTPLIPASFPEEQVKTFGADVPLGRPGQPEEVAPSYIFMASDDASYMTGQVLHPNGGEVVNG